MTIIQEHARVQIRRYRADYAVVGTAFAPAILSVAIQIHPEFLRPLWVLAVKQTRNYNALIVAEEEIGCEAFSWSRAHKFSFDMNFIGKAIAYATATRLHLSVHSTALSARHQAGQPMSSAECLMHGAAYASHCAPPHPAVNVGGQDNDDDITPLLSLHNAAPGGSGDSEDLDGVDCGITHACLHNDPQTDNDDDEQEDTIAKLLGPLSQRKNAGCDDDGMDFSVGVSVGAVVVVGVSGQGVVSLPPSRFPRLLGSPSEIWEYHN